MIAGTGPGPPPHSSVPQPPYWSDGPRDVGPVPTRVSPVAAGFPLILPIDRAQYASRLSASASPHFACAFNIYKRTFTLFFFCCITSIRKSFDTSFIKWVGQYVYDHGHPFHSALRRSGVGKLPPPQSAPSRTLRSLPNSYQASSSKYVSLNVYCTDDSSPVVCVNALSHLLP